jgi:excinuclease ABC subunit A
LTHGEVKFAELFSQVISLDQSPIGTTSRADVCSYSEILTLLRTFYASLPQAKAKGLQPRHFSYNHKRGMCKTCRGLGYKIVDLQYLPSVKITCDECHGHKLNSNSLSIHYKGKNMGEVLELTIDEAVGFLEAFPRIVKKLTTLSNVGLGYLHLGQEINSLSGGEAQRLRLSKELAKRKNKNALYLFDEPSKGLHYEDIANLLPIFYELARENTLILIEHNTDIIKRCDYIIEMGPFGGDQGGQIIATGCLEEIKKNKKSLTAKYL